MAQFYLINTVTVGSQKYLSGRLCDSAIDPTSDMAAVGGLLWPASDATVAAASVIALARHAYRGASEADGDAVMASAAKASLKAGTSITAATTTTAGAMSAADKKFLDGTHEGPSANLADADATILVTAGKWRKLPAATLSAGRSITLGTTGAVAGDQIVITRLDVSANTLAFINGGAGAGTMFTMAVSKLGCATFQFDGTNWALKDFGVQ